VVFANTLTLILKMVSVGTQCAEEYTRVLRVYPSCVIREGLTVDEEKTTEVISKLRHKEKGLTYVSYSSHKDRVDMLKRYREREIALENTDFQN
jgi:hypothetical protein